MVGLLGLPVYGLLRHHYALVTVSVYVFTFCPS